jgi:hypothetical protein
MSQGLAGGAAFQRNPVRMADPYTGDGGGGRMAELPSVLEKPEADEAARDGHTPERVFEDGVSAALADPLSVDHFLSCLSGERHFAGDQWMRVNVSATDAVSGLRAVRYTPPGNEGPVLGVHNPTAATQEFDIAEQFPEVADGRAHLVFIGGDVETSSSLDGSLQGRLRPGAHVWLAQVDDLGTANVAQLFQAAPEELSGSDS